MLNKRGQNTAEYAILIAIIVAAAVGIQTYVKQSLQGKIADGLNHTGQSLTIGEESFTFSKQRFEPAAIDSEVGTVSERSYDENIAVSGQVDHTEYKEESKIRSDSYEKYK